MRDSLAHCRCFSSRSMSCHVHFIHPSRIGCKIVNGRAGIIWARVISSIVRFLSYGRWEASMNFAQTAVDSLSNYALLNFNFWSFGQSAVRRQDCQLFLRCFMHYVQLHIQSITNGLNLLGGVLQSTDKIRLTKSVGVWICIIILCRFSCWFL